MLSVFNGTWMTQMLRMTAVFLFIFFVIFPPFVISTRRAKILIRGHQHYPCHLRAIKHRFARNETLFCEGENIRFRRVVGGSLRWKATGSSRQLLFVLQRYNIGTRLSSVSPIFFLSFCVLNNFTNPFSVPIRIISNQ